MTLGRLSVAALLLLACGDDDPGGGDDGNDDGAAVDAAGTPDAAGDPDSAAPDADASVSDAAPEADGGGAVDCPSPGEPTDGLSPTWLEGIVAADPDIPSATSIRSVAEGPGCSVLVAGRTTQTVVLGQGQPGEVTLEGAREFVARYRADGTFLWVADIGEYQPGPESIDSVEVLADGTAVAIRQVGVAGVELVRISTDGVVLGEPEELEAHLVLPRSSGAYVVRQVGTGEYTLELLSADGDVQWSRSVGFAYSLVELPDGRILHTGGYDFGGLVLNQGQPDEQVIDTDDNGCYVALSESDGSLVWVRTVSTDGTAWLLCDADVADGWVAAVARYSNAFDVLQFFLDDGDGEPIETGTWQAIVLRYGLDGTLAWYRGVIPGQEGDLIGMETDTFHVGRSVDGLVTFGGSMTGTFLIEQGGPSGGLATVTTEPEQGWFARYTADGELVGVRTFESPEPGTSVVNASATRADGSVVLVGDFDQTLVIEPLQLTAVSFGASYLVEVR